MLLTLLFFFVIILIVIVLILLVIILKKIGVDNSSILSDCFSSYDKKLSEYERNIKDEFSRTRTENLGSLTHFQEAINGKFDTLTKNTTDSVVNSYDKILNILQGQLGESDRKLQAAMESQQEKVQTGLKNIQESNEKKLDEMRGIVDEKLQSTLERRLSSSFELVSKQLEEVQKGLGEMQTLASDVGGLKRALTNVKTAGNMGEVQLEALISQLLSPDQFEMQAHPNPSDTKKVVEFAVKLPSKDTERGFVYLPIDSKYPATTWENLTIAYEKGDKQDIEKFRKNLISEIKKMAKDIKEKYIAPPFTTDFAVMFLPFEGLFSEVIRLPDLFQQLQKEYSITVTGPTTLSAFLNSLRMGFRTLTIQEKTSQIWEYIGIVRSEFKKFGDTLKATREKLEAATREKSTMLKRKVVLLKKNLTAWMRQLC